MLVEVGAEAPKRSSRCCEGPFHGASPLCGPFSGRSRLASEVTVSRIPTVRVAEMQLMCPAAVYRLPNQLL